MPELIELSAGDLHRKLIAGDVTARQIVERYLDRIEQIDGRVGAFNTVTAEAALDKAADIDDRLDKGEAVGPLAGVPIALKDNLCTRGVPTTCSSRILEHFVPPYDATVVERLQRADAVLIGKTNLDEFAMGSTTEASAFATTANPWDLSRVPGGSSGGSAAAVAAGLAPLALGSDTGGSIRQPAAFCGVTGLKPTYGRVSRYGLIAYASSLDQIGTFSRDPRDAALLLEVIAGHDPRDSTSAQEPVPDYSAELEKDVAGVKVGLPREYLAEGIAPDVEAAVRAAADTCRGLGAEVIDISLPHTEYAVATYYIIGTAEASSNLARFDGIHYGRRAAGKMDVDELYSRSRSEGLGDEVKRRIMLGTFALSAGYYDAYYLKALKVRRLIKKDFDDALAGVDCILAPVAPTVAYKQGEMIDDPLALYLADIYTSATNLAGLPAIAFNAGTGEGGLPVGVQLMGRPFEESGLLRLAHAFRGATDHHLARPNLTED